MTDLKHYMQDGASAQARAVLAMVQNLIIDSSWDDRYFRYKAEPSVARWENCREQGYVISLYSESFKQLNIAFFQHRNSDVICAIRWEESTINSPNIESANFNEQVYSDKWDVTFEANYGEILKMANWIEKEFIDFWDKSINKLAEVKE